jgi:hypothetical protein
MTPITKTSLSALTLLLCLPPFLHGQAVPTASTGTPSFNPGPSLPMIDGNLQYAISASEGLQTGLNSTSGVTETTGLSGDVEYLSSSAVHPTTLLYAGGVYFSSISAQGAQTFQSISASQGLVGHGWAVGVSDSFSFLPQSPTTGLIGIPGIGDLGLQPITDPSVPSQSVLTNYGKRFSNTLGGSVERQLTGRDSISASANYGILHFIGKPYVGSDNLNSTQLSGNLSFNHRIDRRSSMSIGAQYSTFYYSSNTTSFNTRGLNLQYSRQLSKNLNFQVSAGPQWINSFGASDPTFTVAQKIPAVLTVQASAGLTYTRRVTTASLSYSRGVNSGSGIQTGAISDGISASVQRSYGRNWSGAISAAYTHTAGLVLGNASSVYGGVQVNRRLTGYLSAFGSYSGVHQSIDSTLAARNAFSGFSQVFAVGITFSPRRSRLGQF